MSNKQFLSKIRNAYGVEWNYDTNVWTRLGLARGMVRADFDLVNPWLSHKRCTVADAKTINHYFGEGGYLEDGSDGQVMVYQPLIYMAVEYIKSPNRFRWWISPFPFEGSFIHPNFIRNSVLKTHIFAGAYEASAYAVGSVATVKTLVITAACSASGDLNVTMDGSLVAVSVLDTDDATGVATKIRAATFTGWTLSGSGTTVIFTSDAVGYRGGTYIFDGASTGVTATLANTTLGEPGYLNNDEAGLDFTATTGDKLCSISTVKPISGKNNTLNFANARKLAVNRGAGWGLHDFLSLSVSQMMYLIEYASPFAQTEIGAGVTGESDDGSTNMAHVTGATTALGNASGRQTGTDNLCSVSYRGIENLWGNIMKFVEGVNKKSDQTIWLADHDFVCDTYAHPYIKLRDNIANLNNYFGLPMRSPNHPGFLPVYTEGGGTKIGDSFRDYQNGNAIMLKGAPKSWNGGTGEGLFACTTESASSTYERWIGCRLMAIP
jgi:hypothetical protein